MQQSSRTEQTYDASARCWNRADESQVSHTVRRVSGHGEKAQKNSVDITLHGSRRRRPTNVPALLSSLINCWTLVISWSRTWSKSSYYHVRRRTAVWYNCVYTTGTHEHIWTQIRAIIECKSIAAIAEMSLGENECINNFLQSYKLKRHYINLQFIQKMDILTSVTCYYFHNWLVVGFSVEYKLSDLDVHTCSWVQKQLDGAQQTAHSGLLIQSNTKEKTLPNVHIMG